MELNTTIGWHIMTETAAVQHVRENEAIPDIDIYCGTATPELARLVAERLGRPLGRRDVDHFADGECHVQIQESVRGRDIYIVQSTCHPVNEHLMELLVMIDLTAIPLLANHLHTHIDVHNAVLVTPDTGRVKVAEMYANLLNVPLVVMHKRRSGERGEGVEVGVVVGSVEGKHPIIVDDIVSTGNTIITCAKALLDAGAVPNMTVVFKHARLSPAAEERLAMPE